MDNFNLNFEEKNAVKLLQVRMKNDLPSDMQTDSTLFYRFLKARNFDVNKAEIMLRKCIAWRKAFQVEKFLDTFKPNEIVERYLLPCLIGYSKDGNLVRYIAAGKIDITDVTNCIKMNDLIKHYMWLGERNFQQLQEENIKTGKNAYQDTYIVNLDQLPFSNVTNRATSDLLIRLANVLQDNYPERLKSVYIINAPTIFAIIFSIIKKILAQALIQKIYIFGQSDWKAALLQVIDADVLPVFLGGKRTDPDGDGMCRSFISHGVRVPAKYFLSEDERRFKSTDHVVKVTVPSGSNFKIPLNVNVGGSIIHWAFEVRRSDIGFGLLLQKSEEEFENLLPIQRIVTCDGTDKGSFKCQSAGTYIIIFDNSHGFLNTKEVFYCVTVEKPVL